ncbi:restriction endonuclease subunit S [Sphingobacterium multivorum]|uniref:Type I restriction modification DNA specificity domain n=1 Tax=Sphingobacterium multivorum TaxID=28454 RepID=A0A2X2LRN8_SPHMU|nr:restriction endonuclease subunit S [Sphingobacterium multivorum]QRQ59988.1 restriction endonuclease subunit S [Sphingobacterium multivorum]SPZ92150.1 Type I restriction modification DNA specificity domain [Sphingobacterium multivorum]
MRFPGFEGEWETKKLGEIATFSKGKGISKSDIAENGLTECIRYGELYTYYGEVINDIKSKTNVDTSNLVLSEVNDVIIPASGETTIDIATASCVLKSGIALGGDLNIIKTENNGVFLSYYLNNKKKMEIANLAQGISVVHLYSSQLATLTLSFPKLKEQNRISTFLALFDERIQTQNKIIEELKLLKNTIRYQLYEQILNQENELVQVKDALNYEQPTKYLVTNTDYSSDISLIPVLTANKAFVLGYTDEEYGIYDKGQCIIFDDFTMDVKFVDFLFKVKSSAIKILTAKPNVNLKFIFEYLSFLNLSSNEHKRHYISEIEPMEIQLPNYIQQKHVANFLSSIDDKVKTEFEIHMLLIKQKQYLLANLFI